MNFLLLLVISTWHVGRSLNSSQSEQHCLDGSAERSARQISLSLELYKATANVKTGFFAISTVDAFFLLWSLYRGADGLSKQQLGKVLRYSSDCYPYSSLLEFLFETDKLRTSGASMNRQIFHAFEPTLENFIAKKYSLIGSRPHCISSWGTLTSGTAIYEWARTCHIVNADKQPFEGEKSLVLASAASFQSDFKFFSSHRSQIKATFHYNSDSRFDGYDYSKMTAKIYNGKLKYSRDSHDGNTTAKYIVLPWKNEYGDEIETILILPREIDGITELEKNINENTIREMRTNRIRSWVETTLPQDMVFDSALNLIEPLKNMGLTAMFEAINNVTSINETRSIKVGPVLQQTKIHHKWIAGSYGRFIHSKRRPVTKFFANHPFIILTIYESKNPFILYMGRHGWIPGVTDAEVL